MKPGKPNAVQHSFLHLSYFPALLLLFACGSQPLNNQNAAISDLGNILLVDEIVLSDDTPVKTLPNIQISELSDEIKALLDKEIKPIKNPYKRIAELKLLTLSKDKLGIRYDNSKTKSASETFNSRSANCLSFSILFASMARYVNIPTHYQLVYTPPVWTKEKNMWIYNHHINTVSNFRLKHMQFFLDKELKNTFSYNEHTSNSDFNRNKRFVVDVDPSISIWASRKEILNNSQVESLFYANLAVEELIKGHIVNSYLYAKKAIQADPQSSYAWNTVAIIYKRLNHQDLSERTLRYAIQLDPDNYTAMSNLARLYKNQHKYEQANALMQKVLKYQKKNPYYHYMLAEKDFDKGLYKQSILKLNQAVKMKHNEHEFYFALAKSHAKLGNINQVKENLKQATIYSNGGNKSRYRYKLRKINTYYPEKETEFHF